MSVPAPNFRKLRRFIVPSVRSSDEASVRPSRGGFVNLVSAIDQIMAPLIVGATFRRDRKPGWMTV
jgi:hypothetical protein